MIKGVVIKKLNKNIDERGWLAEIYRSDETDYKPAMGYVSMTKPGIVRGPHEHVKQSDCFVFIGPGSFELHLWDKRKNSETKDKPTSATPFVPPGGTSEVRKASATAKATAGKYMKIEAGEDNPSMIIVPPGIVHGYKCISDIPGYCINLADKLYKGEGKDEEVDEIRWEGRKDSPYRIN